MAQIGKFLEKKFLNKEVEFYTGFDSEWIDYSDTNTINGAIICGVFREYDEECGVITLSSVHDGTLFYVAEDTIEMIWEPGLKIVKTIKTMINTGQKLYNKQRDIM